MIVSVSYGRFDLSDMLYRDLAKYHCSDLQWPKSKGSILSVFKIEYDGHSLTFYVSR